MSGNMDRLAQTWPRIIISSMFLTWVLEPVSPAVFSTSSAIIGINALLIAYAVIRKSLIATRLLYASWWLGVVMLLFCGLAIVVLGLSDASAALEVKEKLVAEYPVNHMVRDAVLQVVNGWALVVHKRDLKGRRRNAWGRLVQYEGYIVLQTQDVKDTA